MRLGLLACIASSAAFAVACGGSDFSSNGGAGTGSGTDGGAATGGASQGSGGSGGSSASGGSGGSSGGGAGGSGGSGGGVAGSGTGGGDTGGTGGSGGDTGGSAGVGAAGAGTGGSGGSATGGSAGAAGSIGSGGAAASGGSAGVGGSAGAAGSGGSGTGGSAGAAGSGGSGTGGSAGAAGSGGSGTGGSAGAAGSGGSAGAAGSGGSAGAAGSGGSAGAAGSGGSGGSAGAAGSGGSAGAAGSGGTGGCVPTGAEVCDGVDNDCNNAIDDGIAPVACSTGLFGACAAGTQSCVGGSLGACTGPSPSGETCDGLDNDCNNLVDDGIAPIACATGLLGVCAPGTQSCVGGSFGACIGASPVNEKCDGLDNNCNGVVDDGNPGGGAACGTGSVGGCTSLMMCRGGALQCVGTFVGPAPMGNVANPGTKTQPLASIVAGIANAQLLGGGADVCVCDDTTVAGPSTFSEDVTMVEGTSVIGGYSCNAWARVIATNVTRIQDTNHSGVKFLAGITAVTALDGFTVLGQNVNVGSSAAITVVDSSPTLQDLTVQGGFAPLSYGLLVIEDPGSLSAPAVNNGSYTATAGSGGTQIAVELDAASPKFNNVSIGASSGGAVASANTSVGLRCIDCSGTSITTGSISGGQATTTVAGLWATGDVATLTVTNTPITGGNAQGGVNPIARGVYLDTCRGAPVFTGSNIFGGWGPTGTRVGFDVSGAACAPSASGGFMIGCEVGATCIAAQSTGAPITISGVPNIMGSGSASVATYGVRCLAGGCTKVTTSTIFAGMLGGASAGTGMGIDVELSSPLFDSNNIRGPSCANAVPLAGAYYGSYVRGGSMTLVNNVIRDGGCMAPQDVLRFEKVSLGPVLFSPTFVNDTLEYITCTGCAQRRGISIISPSGSAGPAGIFNNLIVRNTAAGGISWPVYEWDADSAPISFHNNDLYDFTATALYQYQGVTPLTTIVLVDATVPSAQNDLAVNPQLDATWHINGASPCRDTGTASSAPDHDFEGDSRPLQSTYDIGADENKN